jgi:hypothetical protein
MPELDLAHEFGKRVVVITAQDVNPAIVRADLAALSWIFFPEKGTGTRARRPVSPHAHTRARPPQTTQGLRMRRSSWARPSTTVRGQRAVAPCRARVYRQHGPALPRRLRACQDPHAAHAVRAQVRAERLRRGVHAQGTRRAGTLPAPGFACGGPPRGSLGAASSARSSGCSTQPWARSRDPPCCTSVCSPTGARPPRARPARSAEAGTSSLGIPTSLANQEDLKSAPSPLRASTYMCYARQGASGHTPARPPAHPTVVLTRPTHVRRRGLREAASGAPAGLPA